MLTAQDLIEMRKMIAAAAVVQKGDLSEELEKLAKLSTEVDAKLGLVKSLDDLGKARDQISAELEKRDAELTAREEATAKTIMDAAQGELELDKKKGEVAALAAALDARGVAITQSENRLKAAWAEHEGAVESLKLAGDRQRQTLVDRENKVLAGERSLAERISRLAKI